MTKQLLTLIGLVIVSLIIFSIWDVFLGVAGLKTGTTVVVTDIGTQLFDTGVEQIITTGRRI